MLIGEATTCVRRRSGRQNYRLAPIEMREKEAKENLIKFRGAFPPLIRHLKFRREKEKSFAIRKS